MPHWISPSDLTFLYGSCPLCFTLKVRHGVTQPSIPMPSIFSSIAEAQETFFTGKRTEEVLPSLPPGVIRFGEEKVRSVPLEFSGSGTPLVINGRFDSLVQLDDGNWALLDFKTGQPGEAMAAMYSRQLHAYVRAMEQAAEGFPSIKPITRLGLLSFVPEDVRQETPQRQLLGGSLEWTEVERDDAGFDAFLAEVAGVLDGDPPDATEDCLWCSYRGDMRQLSGPGASAGDAGGETIDIPNCPRCEGPMKLRKGQYGAFFGCLKYPECKGTVDARDR